MCTSCNQPIKTLKEWRRSEERSLCSASGQEEEHRVPAAAAVDQVEFNAGHQHRRMTCPSDRNLLSTGEQQQSDFNIIRNQKPRPEKSSQEV